MNNEINEPQLELFEVSKKTKDKSMTFVDNMKLPIHRWYRYSAGFSGGWVKELIKQKNAKQVIDPFVGSGTVALECEFAGIDAYGVDAHPFVNRIANAKLYWKEDIDSFRETSKELLNKAKSISLLNPIYPPLIQKCYPHETIKKLDSLKQAWLTSTFEKPYKELLWLAITSILRVTSPVGTASWQYVLPNKSKSSTIDPYQAFQAQVQEMVTDMRVMQKNVSNRGNSIVVLEDSRKMESIPSNWADLVITSPPYANNYDYGDATRLEMTFWGEVEGWGDLQEKVRKYLVVSCTQHATKIRNSIEEKLESKEIEPIRKELIYKYEKLSEIRLTKGGKKNYQLMILGYFYDLAQIFVELRRTTKSGAEMCFVIGDSAPYGIYVPVDKWLGELAIANGFKSYSFEKLRDRNTKWKNRKHRVPLKEGRLWIK